MENEPYDEDDEFEAAFDLRSVAGAMLSDSPMPFWSLSALLDEEGMLAALHGAGLEGEAFEARVRDVVLATDDLWCTADDMVARSDDLIDDSMFTHRLTGEEIERGEVVEIPDLVVLDWAAPERLSLPDGSELTRVLGVPRAESAYTGPDGWLDSFSPGDVVAFTRSGTLVEVSLAGELSDDDREVGLLKDTLDGWLRPGGYQEAPPFVLDALTAALVAGDPAWRRPVRPLGELLGAAGLERRGLSFGRRGEKWASAAEQVDEALRTQLIETWSLDRSCRDAFDSVLGAYRDFVAGNEIDARGTAEHLGHGAVAPAFTEFVLGSTGTIGDLRSFAESVVAASPARQTAPARCLLGAVVEDEGDAQEAESIFRQALRDDPSYGLAAYCLADFAVDRGDVDQAVMLFRHPHLGEGNPTLAYLEDLQRARREATHGVGRNDPCPCGSGRKFKVCCQRNAGVPLSERTTLLTHKLVRFATREEYRTTVEVLARGAEAARGDDPDDPGMGMADDPVIRDIAMWEGGIAAGYLAQRGVLLPEDERELLEVLIDGPRRMWEITDMERGVSLTLRDTASGDTVTVHEHLGSLEAEVGQFLLARVAHLGPVSQIMGAVMDVPLRVRDSALALIDMDPTAYDLAEWYGACYAPPVMTNREGEPIALCKAELTTGFEAEAVRAALDAVLESDDEDVWTDKVTLPDGDRVVRGFVRAAPGVVTLETNSEERMERLVDLVADAPPDAEVVTDECLTGAALLRALAEGRSAGPGAIDNGGHGLFEPTVPEGARAAQAALEQFIREKERGWVDESIPALGGLTPRQAADDPTRREDLIALLRSFDDLPHPPGGMSYDPDRLRSLLGMPSPG